MDEKTAELRDIFLETTGEEAVEERGGDRRGSLADVDDPERVDAKLRELVATMRERYDFDADLGSTATVRLIRGFFDGADDRTLADALGVDVGTVRRGRLDCHLVREADRDVPGFAAVRDRIVADGEASDDAVAAAVRAEGDAPDVDAATVAHVRRVVAAERAAVRANGRFRDAFAELLTDDDLTGRLASDAREDGLREATADIETDVSF
jgi:hypothetical protein